METETKRVDLLIYGTTAAGIAAAITARNAGISCLLAEETILLGHDFCACHKIAQTFPAEHAPLATALCAELTARGLWREGRVHIAAVSGVLANALLCAEVPVWLSAKYGAWERTDAGYRVRFFTKNGWETVETKRILDTSVLGMCGDMKRTGFTRSLSLPLDAMEPVKTPISPLAGGACLERGLWENEWYLRCPVPFSLSLPAVRQRVQTIWQENRALLPELALIGIPPAFRYDADQPITVSVRDGWIWHPSAAHGDFFAAIAGGEALV